MQECPNRICPGLIGELSPVCKSTQSCFQGATPDHLSTVSFMQHLSCKAMVVKSTGILTKGKKTANLDTLSHSFSFQEPFEEMPEFFKGRLTSNDASHLNRVLRKIDMERFLPLLLEMILLKVKHAEENTADMR